MNYQKQDLKSQLLLHNIPRNGAELLLRGCVNSEEDCEHVTGD